MRISVALASYNGEKFIEEQLQSILSQLDDYDEIVISDDGSTDQTISIIHNLQEIHPQIHLIKGPKQGIFRNFMCAISHCKNDIVFLADQDDVWCAEKVKKITTCFEKNKEADVILHNADYLYNSEIQAGRLLAYKKGFWINWAKSSYWGCCMAIRKEFLQKYFNSSTDGIAHDQVIGLLSERNKSTIYIDEILLHHRVHGENKTKRLNLINKILFRIKVYNDFVKIKKGKGN